MEKNASQLQKYLKEHPVGIGPTGFEFHMSPPCDTQAIFQAETDLGFPLPDLLREIYMTIANGGFGPGYGVMGLNGGFTDDLGDTVEKLYARYRTTIPDEPTWEWPEGWLPICHWGCVIYSAVDCLNSPYPVYFMDVSKKEPGESMESITYFHRPSLEKWLSDWMAGKNLWKEVWEK
ncbi:MAG: SMI1/KNR4 family protein [Planctomycetes bacterium]|nr:SMI1/KNR4 family protein [Planctomycetota bacterium]